MWKEITFGIATSLILIFGLSSNYFIICYLKKKIPAYKTAFDQALIDTILSSLVFALGLYSFTLLYLFWPPLSLFSAAIFQLFLLTSCHFFIASCFITICIKFIFIFYGELILEKSECSVRFWSFLTKIILTLIYMILDNFGPFQVNPTSFTFLISQKEEQSPIKPGIGIFLNLFCLLLLTFYVQMKLRSHENLPRLFGAIVVCTIVIFLMVLFEIFLGSLHQDVLILSIFFWIYFLVLVIFPLTVILRNENMKRFIMK